MKLRFEKLTSRGNLLGGDGAISKDGTLAAYVSAEREGPQLEVARIETGERLPLSLLPASFSFWGWNFSPDGKYVYYTVEDVNNPTGGSLYRVPVQGGEPERLLVRINTRVSFSPDGKRFVFRRRVSEETRSDLVIANADGSDQRRWISSTSSSDFWDFRWSHDGQRIGYVRYTEDGAGGLWHLAEREVNGGVEQAISNQRRERITSFDWLPDGKQVVFISRDPESGLRQLWQLTLSGRTEYRLSNDANDYSGLSVSDDGDLMTSLIERPSRLFVAPTFVPGKPRQISSGAPSYDSLEWTPDGRILFVVREQGWLDLWVMNNDGSNARRLTAGVGNNTYPTMSPDGRTVVFFSDRDGRFRLWRMDSDGSNPTPLTRAALGRAQVTPDSKEVLFSRQLHEGWSLWRVPLSGGKEEFAGRMGSPAFEVSRDLRSIAFEPEGKEGQRAGVSISAFDRMISGNPGNIGPRAHYFTMHWFQGGNSLAYVVNSHDLELYSPGSGMRRILLQGPDELIFSFAFSPDSKQVVYNSGRVQCDLVLVRPAGARVAGTTPSRPTSSDRKAIASTSIPSPIRGAEVLALYEKGRDRWKQRTLGGLNSGVGFFQEAVRKDPSFSAAWAGLADCYVLLDSYVLGEPSGSYLKAQEAVSEALRLDPNLAEAHTTQGFINYRYKWDWDGANQEFTRAIELNPGYVTARHWYGEFLIASGRFDGGVSHIREALRLEPSSLIINADLGWALYLSGRDDEALLQLQKTLAMDLSFEMTLYYLIDVYEKKRLYTDATRTFQKWLEMYSGAASPASKSASNLEAVLANSGYSGVLRRRIELLKQASQGKESRMERAKVHALLGEKDQAMEWLERAYQDRNADLVFIRVHPAFDKLRDDRRFNSLLRRINAALSLYGV